MVAFHAPNDAPPPAPRSLVRRRLSPDAIRQRVMLACALAAVVVAAVGYAQCRAAELLVLGLGWVGLALHVAYGIATEND